MGKHTLTENRRLTKQMRYGGPGKLRWFCDACKYQAHNEESFLAHTKSEHHRLMMAQFHANQDSIIKQNSEEFKRQFINILKHQYVNREVLANNVYNQVISDRNHQHMNSTRWESLRGFCSEMSDRGIIEMRMTERGPIIKYVEADPTAENAARITKEVEEQFKKDLTRDEEQIKSILESLPEVKKVEEPKEEQKVDVVITNESKQVKKKISSIFGGSSKPKPQQKKEIKL